MFENFDLINDDLHIEDCNCDVEQHFDSPTMQNTSSMGVSPTYENDSNGGVIVTDIFGEKHQYMDMEQVQTLTDFFSDLPIHTTDRTPSFDGTSNERYLPTDIHTPNDLTFYDDKIEEVQRKLDDAIEDVSKTTNARELEDALERQRQAKNDIEYWKNSRSREDYSQTIEHQMSDKIINDLNDALNNLNDIPHNSDSSLLCVKKTSLNHYNIINVLHIFNK